MEHCQLWGFQVKSEMPMISNIFTSHLWLQSRVDNQLLLDATSDEAFQEDGSILLAMMPSLNQVMTCHVAFDPQS